MGCIPMRGQLVWVLWRLFVHIRIPRTLVARIMAGGHTGLTPTVFILRSIRSSHKKVNWWQMTFLHETNVEKNLPGTTICVS